jgi:hypothetical protein
MNSKIRFGKQLILGAILLAMACTRVEFDNPADIKGTNYNNSGGDKTKPVITLKGSNPMKLPLGEAYIEPDAEATDNVDGAITAFIQISGDVVDVNSAGSYAVVYSVSDKAGNTATVTRTVMVVKDTLAPVIALKGANPLSTKTGLVYVEPGATAVDDVDGDIAARIQITGTVDVAVTGNYELTYTITDKAGNSASVKRIVKVVDVVMAEADTVKPVIALNGKNPDTVMVGAQWLDPGATASDNIDGTLTAKIIVTGTVTTTAPRSVTVTYTVRDSAGNQAQAIRTVVVKVQSGVDNTAPVITLKGENPVMLVINAGMYTEPGFTAIDDFDGDVSANVKITNNIDITKIGTYSVTYKVSDKAGNPAEKNRSIKVTYTTVEVDTTKPVITLLGKNPDTVSVGAVWLDPGFTANDNTDGDIRASVQKVPPTVSTATPGSISITYNVSDNTGNKAVTRTRVVVVKAIVIDTSTLLGKYSVPAKDPIPSINNIQFKTITSEGQQKPDVSAITSVQLNWDTNNKKIYNFGINLNVSPNYADIAGKVTHTLDQPKPEMKIAGSQIAALNGDYYVAMSGTKFVLVSKTGAYAIVFAP